MTAPARRVLPLPESPDSRPIKDGFDPPSKATCGFCFAGPDRLQYLDDVACFDISDMEVTDHLASIGIDRVLPLVGMFFVLPTGPMRSDVLSGGFRERDTLRVVSASGCLPSTPGFNRIDAVSQKLPRPSRSLAGLAQAKRVEIAKAHIAGLPRKHVAKQP